MNKIHHFVLSWQNIGALRDMLDTVATNEDLFLDVFVVPPYEEKGNVEEKASLNFSLEHVEQTQTGFEGKTVAFLEYEETEEDPASGVAYPEWIEKDENE